MSKLIRIIVIILCAFALASLFIFRLRIADAPMPASPPQSAINSDVKTVEGQIGAVDTDTKTVTLVDGDKVEETWTIVGPQEANARLGRISNVSPVGAALLGRVAGEFAEVRTPRGAVRCSLRTV